MMEEINYEVPFAANSKDDMHCFQACLSMIIKYFYPTRSPNFAQLDIATGHQPGKGTWPLMGLNYLRSLGIEVSIITPFSYEEFVKRGVDYIREQYGDEVAQWQDENNDLVADAKMIEELLPSAKIENRDPGYEDILTNLKNFPVMCSIESSVTRGEDEYTGHFVVIRGANDEGLFLNDPGLPARENVFVERKIFEKAWANFSGEDSKFLYPIKSFSAI